MGCLYQIEFPNGKKYIGITKFSAEKRFAGHIKFSNRGSAALVHRAIRKYGKENCKIFTLAIANDMEYLKDLEVKTIAAFKTKPPHGYNCSDGGDGLLNPTKDIREKISIAHKEKWKEKEYRELMVDKCSKPERKEKHRSSAKKQWLDKKTRSKILNSIKTEKYKKKQSEISKKRWQDPEQRAIMSAAIKKVWQDPEVIARRRALMQSSEYKKKCSEAAHKRLSLLKEKKGGVYAIW